MRISSIAKKAGAVTVAAAMLTSLASCDMIFGQKAVIEAAENFGDAVISADAGKILKCSNEEDDGEVAEALELILDMDLRTDDFQEYADAMKDTMTYEIDSGSVKIDGKKATCDITFSMADFEDLDDGDYEDIDDIVDAIEDLDTKEYEFTIKFEKDDDEWIVTNLKSDDFGAIFDYLSYSLPVCDIIGDYVAVYDMTSILAESLTGSLGVDMDMEGSVLSTWTLSIYDDGTCYIALDTDSLVESLKVYINDNLDIMFMSAFGATSVDELEDYASLLGYDSYDAMKADLGDQIEEAIAADESSLETAEGYGTYTVEGDTITFNVDGYDTGSVGKIENGNIIFDVEVDEDLFGSGNIELVFEPVAAG